MSPRADIVLLWHMHQPDYRDHAAGEFTQPWVYLHALKDYADMAAHLERHTGVRAVLNFVPVLLDQLEDYADQFATGTIRDPLLRLLVREETSPLTSVERQHIITQCFRADDDKMVGPYPAYKRLHQLYVRLESHGPAALDYLADRYCYDLVTWYHLAWTGETVRRASELVTRLMTSGVGFSLADRRALFDLIGDVVKGIIPRYAKLAASGRIELSTTPQYHPLAPLLIDFKSAREARADLKLPAGSYPGGVERVRMHIDDALESHARRFGAPPAGVWPAEGAVSARVLDLLAERGVRWTASSESVLAHTLRAANEPMPERWQYLYRPWDTGRQGGLSCFFRDDRLSDLIGFEYPRWHSADAAAHFVGELESIAAHATADATPLVPVILDGENCWEYYPYNGFYFLDSLYAELEAHAHLRTTTFAAALGPSDPSRPRAAPRRLPPLVAGSWVYGDFTTWIGSPDKNRAWELLVAAKQSFDLVVGSGRLSESQIAKAMQQLADCEGSDWFWWMGDYNSAFAVATFDSLYRANLAHLYALLNLPLPSALAQRISLGRGHPELGGAMRRAEMKG